MQVLPSYEDAFIAVPGILIGMAIGYAIAGQEDLAWKYRIGLGVVTGLFGGSITGLLLYNYLDNTTFEIFLIIISYFGGYILGAIANWAPLPEKPPERHVIFEPDDDDEFDRQIDEALGGKANNS